MRISSKDFSLPDLLPWISALVGLGVLYATLSAQTSDALKRADEAMVKAENANINSTILQSDIRVLNVKLDNLDGKIEDIRARIPRSSGLVQNNK